MGLQNRNEMQQERRVLGRAGAPGRDLYGGAEGNRTPVQKVLPVIYYKRSLHLFESLPGTLQTKCRVASPMVFGFAYQAVSETAS